MLSIRKAELRSSVLNARLKIRKQIGAGQNLAGHIVQNNWKSLDEFRASKRVWSDYATELLINLFNAPLVAEEFNNTVKGARTSGSASEFIRDENQGVLRGIAYLQSLEQRLDLLAPETEVSKIKIPFPVISVVSEALQLKYTHARMNFLMKKAGISSPQLPVTINKLDKARALLELSNDHNSPLDVLGIILEEIMEGLIPSACPLLMSRFPICETRSIPHLLTKACCMSKVVK